jgi:hypothetical protein
MILKAFVLLNISFYTCFFISFLWKCYKEILFQQPLNKEAGKRKKGSFKRVVDYNSWENLAKINILFFLFLKGAPHIYFEMIYFCGKS